MRVGEKIGFGFGIGLGLGTLVGSIVTSALKANSNKEAQELIDKVMNAKTVEK